VRAAATLAAALAVAACSEVGPFYCDDSVQCSFEDDDGELVTGTCVMEFFSCAYTDATCPAPMLRYTEVSDPDLAGVCVGQEDQ
jgi:hypothetical protein